MLPVSPLSLPTPQPVQDSARDAELREAAQKLEATFLAEMLKSAGMGQSRDTFGGGAGEDQFSSFLLQAQAEKIVESGGFGLSEALFQSLKERDHDV